jgi:hypothetical protein
MTLLIIIKNIAPRGIAMHDFSINWIFGEDLSYCFLFFVSQLKPNPADLN